MDGKDSKDDTLKDLPLMDGKDDSSTNLPRMEGKDDYLTSRQQPLDHVIPENKAEDLNSPPDDNHRFYFLDKSADISELTALHHKSDGKAEYTKWRSWNFAQEIDNKKKDKLIEQMAARLQEIEEKLQKIQKSGTE